VGLDRSRSGPSRPYVRGVGSLCAGNASWLRGELIRLDKAKIAATFLSTFDFIIWPAPNLTVIIK
jgi:hypothetical protein